MKKWDVTWVGGFYIATLFQSAYYVKLEKNYKQDSKI